MPNTNVTAEKSMDEILAQVQREYGDRNKQEPRSVNFSPPTEAHNANQGGGMDSSSNSGVPKESVDGVTTAVAQLAAIYTQRRRVTEFPIGNASSLEEVVRELLRPVLQGWLEDKLTGIVERIVKTELSRIIGDAV
jgi:cell pole-organizing protein PopZ